MTLRCNLVYFIGYSYFPNLASILFDPKEESRYCGNLFWIIFTDKLMEPFVGNTTRAYTESLSGMFISNE